jgi:hypothetical protein
MEPLRTLARSTTLSFPGGFVRRRWVLLTALQSDAVATASCLEPDDGQSVMCLAEPCASQP